MKKIANIIPTLTNGGAERVVSSISMGLPSRIKQYIFLFDGKDVDYEYKGELINLNCKARSGVFGKLVNLFIRVCKTKREKKEKGIDVAISHLENANVVNILSKNKEMVVVTIHNMKSKEKMGFYGNIYALLIKLLYNYADVIVAVSEGVKYDLIENFGITECKIKVIYNFFDIKKIQELAKEKIDTEYENIFKNLVVINTGRLTYQKGQWHLIRSFKKVVNKISKANLVILGQGDLEKYLKELAENLGLSQNVHFLGFKKNPFKYIANSDVAVLPSLYEGFPMVLSEAMASGTTIIYSDCKSGPREVLAPNTDIKRSTTTSEMAEYGMLVPVPDGVLYEATHPLTNEEIILADIIIKTLEDDNLRKTFSSKGKKRVEEYGIDKITKIWVDLIENN